MKDLGKYNRFKDYIDGDDGNGNILVMTYEEFMVASEGVKPTHTNLKMKCVCGKEYFRSFNNFRTSKKMCVSCTCSEANKINLKTDDEFKTEVFKLVGNDYSVLNKYVDAKTKVRFQHNGGCGNIFDMIPSNFTAVLQQRCPKCSNSKKSQEQYIFEINEVHGESISVIGEYKGARNKVLARHNSKSCNYHEWKVDAGNLLNGSGCPRCRISKGEKAIEEFLVENKINYKTQHKMEGLRDIRSLKFDFAIFNRDGEHVKNCEFDGEYHYVLTRHSNAKELLEGQQRRDKLKNDYCKENNIPLLRIPYWEFDNIEAILEEELSELIQ